HALLALKDSSKQVQTFYAEAFRRMNDDFEKIRAFAGQNDYELIITSGHGFSPIHTSINIENLLIEQGIDLHDNGSKRTIKGIPGKVSAHLYINDQLTAVEHSEIVKKLEEAFNNLEDPKSGERVVENIFQKQGLEEIGLAHPNAGDLFIQLKPGYVFHHGGADDQGIFGIPLFKGDHGYSLKHEDSYGIFIADVPCDPCTTTSVAKVIEGILN
ncbi:MAG: alkaline phosphatase family protein, partial [Bacteroidota bacterium]